jgi:hypothetical protein
VHVVQIAFQIGINCDSPAKIASLNGGAGVSFNFETQCNCFLRDSITTLSFPADDYNLGASNSMLLTNAVNCVGFHNMQSGSAVDNWAEVCVYAGACF